MSDALIGVLIGGLIASLAPLAQLVVDHRRWRAESYLEYCRVERRRYEELYARLLNGFGDAIYKDAYDAEIVTSLQTLVPKGVSDVFESWMSKKDHTDWDKKVAYMNMAKAMRNHLAELDQEIRKAVCK
jgi:hypothetical protein